MPIIAPQLMKLAMIESPYRGERQRNLVYLHRLIRHVTLEEGYAPYASHLMMTLALDDNLSAERRIGILAGYAWAHRADAAFFGLDYGISAGMRAARDYYDSIGLQCYDLTIGENDAEQERETAQDDGRGSPLEGVRQEGGHSAERGEGV